jgi:hypothetical protein
VVVVVVRGTGPAVQEALAEAETVEELLGPEPERMVMQIVAEVVVRVVLEHLIITAKAVLVVLE